MFTTCSFVALSVLMLRALLGIDGIEGLTGLTIYVGINGSIVMSKLDASIADAEASESLLLSSLITVTQRIAPFEKL